MNKTMTSQFLSKLRRLYEGNKVYAKDVDDPSDSQILADLKAGRFTIRKVIDRQGYKIEKYLIIECIEKRAKRQRIENNRADRANKAYDAAYYKAVDAVTFAESAVAASKVVNDFEALTKKHVAENKK